MKGKVCRLLLVLMAMASRSALAYTQAQDFYMRGVRAHDEGNCSESVALMREAIQRDGSEALSSFKYKGLNTEDYLPHFYLGRCYEKLGWPVEALGEFRESERQGAVKGRASVSAILRAALARVEAALPRPTATPERVAEVRPAETPTGVPAPETLPTRLVSVATAPPVATLTREEFVKSAVPPELTEPLRKGMKAFFEAEYEEAIRQLEPIAGQAPQGRVFLAYSKAGQWLARGEGECLIVAARSDYVASRKFVRAEIERKWISPAILRALSGGEPTQEKR
jgi:hypothetical protein